MGKDRRRKDTGKRQPATPSSNETDSDPKGQREPRVRAQHREIPKNTDATVKDKTVDNIPIEEGETKKSEPINTEELFANLKRETDEIKALTTKKFAKRQIFSNWEKYEEPTPPPQYEVDIQGADFESLLEAPTSGGGHFQFKSERSWDANVSALSGELFSLDVDLLADGLATIPLYKKLDLPITLFSKDELENMDCLARTALKQYHTIKINVKNARDKKNDAKEIANRLLDMIKESSPAPTDKNPAEDKIDLNFDIDQLEVQNDDENVYEKESYNNLCINNTSEIYKKAELKQSPPPCFRVNEISPKEHPNTTLKSLNEVPEEPLKDVQHEILPSRDIKKGTLSDKTNKKVNVLSKEIKSEVQEEVAPERENRKEIKKELSPVIETTNAIRNIINEEVVPIRETRKKIKNVVKEEIASVKETTKEIKNIVKEEVVPVRETRKEIKNVIKEEVAPARETRKESTPPKEIKREQITPIKDIKKESTNPKEMTSDIPEEIQQELEVDSSENVVQEPVIPLGQRKSRRKVKNQSQLSEDQSNALVSKSHSETHVSENHKKVQVSENQNKVHVSESERKVQVSESQNKAHVSGNQKKPQVMENKRKSQSPENQSKNQVTENKNKSEGVENQKKVQISENQVKTQQRKSQPRPKQTKLQQGDDDLDFLLSLKKPVRESQLSGLQPSQVAKPSIEEDDTSEPSSNLTLVSPQKQTEDLEDWLDSMLDD